MGCTFHIYTSAFPKTSPSFVHSFEPKKSKTRCNVTASVCFPRQGRAFLHDSFLVGIKKHFDIFLGLHVFTQTYIPYFIPLNMFPASSQHHNYVVNNRMGLLIHVRLTAPGIFLSAVLVPMQHNDVLFIPLN